MDGRSKNRVLESVQTWYYQLKIDCYICKFLYVSLMVITKQKPIVERILLSHSDKSLSYLSAATKVMFCFSAFWNQTGTWPKKS